MDNRELGFDDTVGADVSASSARRIFRSDRIIAERLLRMYLCGEGRTGRDRIIDAHLCLELGRQYARTRAATRAKEAEARADAGGSGGRKPASTVG